MAVSKQLTLLRPVQGAWCSLTARAWLHQGCSYSEIVHCAQAPAAALGFRLAAAKWLALVRLLLGEVPEYAELTVQGLAAPLAPYLALAQAVRSGDLTAFQCGLLSS